MGLLSRQGNVLYRNVRRRQGGLEQPRQQGIAKSSNRTAALDVSDTTVWLNSWQNTTYTTIARPWLGDGKLT